MAGGHQLMWMEEDDALEAESEAEDALLRETDAERAVKLEEELESVKKELTDVRKELASKMVQLSKREAAHKATEATLAQHERRQQSEREALARRDSAASAAAAPKEDPLQAVRIKELEAELREAKAQVEQHQMALAEASGARQILQKRLNAVSSEADKLHGSAQESQAARLEAEARVEEELERVTAEAAALKVRFELATAAKAAEVSALQDALLTARTSTITAVKEACMENDEKWEAAVDEMRAGYEAKLRGAVAEREALAKVARGRDGGADAAGSSLMSELAAANTAKAQAQHEFEVYQELASTANRMKSEEIASLMQEIADLKTQLAAAKMATMQQHIGRRDIERGTSRVTTAMDPHQMPAITGVAAVDTRIRAAAASLQNNRVLPVLLVGGLVLLLMTVSIVRAAMSVKGDHPLLCFFAKLGIRIGAGCGGVSAEAVQEAFVEELHHMWEDEALEHDDNAAMLPTASASDG